MLGFVIGVILLEATVFVEILLSDRIAKSLLIELPFSMLMRLVQYYFLILTLVKLECDVCIVCICSNRLCAW